MLKNIVILTKSKKYKNNLCVAGIDTKTGEWVRIVSDDESIQCAVNPKDMLYEDGSSAEILDKVTISLLEHVPSYYQPENYIFDDSKYWIKTGHASINELLSLHPFEEREFIFYDNDRKIEPEKVKKVPKNQLHSLALISPEELRICIKRFDPENPKATLCFDYNDITYDFMSLTDLEFANMYIDRPDGFYKLPGKYLLVVSLGDAYYRDNLHYKIVAKVLKF